MASIFTALSLAFLLSGPAHAGESCQALDEPPRAFQVAWISPVRKRVGGRRTLEVVRVSDLRVLARQYGSSSTRVLQALGLVGKRGGWLFTPDRWKITVFDVESSSLCRPVSGHQEGDLLSGIPVCAASQIKGDRFFTGCGYTEDTVSGGRGLDTYRIRWRDAARAGFCVMPWERFLGGA